MRDCLQHRVPIHAETRGERFAGRETLAGRECAACNILGKGVADLSPQTDARPFNPVWIILLLPRLPEYQAEVGLQRRSNDSSVPGMTAENVALAVPLAYFFPLLRPA
jgi:hypothetical protein